MPLSKLIKISLFHSVVAVIYISLVSMLMSNGSKIFGETDSALSGVAVLLLLVISASVMGFLIFGKSILLYLDGFKKEALKLFFLTITWLALIAFIIFGVLIIIK